MRYRSYSITYLQKQTRKRSFISGTLFYGEQFVRDSTVVLIKARICENNPKL